MDRTDRDELQAFAKKMHDEGAAGFAAGLTPWETWDDFEDRVGSRVWQGTAEHVADQGRPTHSFGDRVITAMTLLAVATLAVGIAGVYVSQRPALQVADNRTPLPSGSPTLSPETDPALQGTAVDTTQALVALDDVTLPATPASPVSGSETIDTASGPSGVDSINQGGNQPVPAAPVGGNNMLARLDEPPAASMAALPAPPAGKTAGLDNETAAPATPADGNNILARLEEAPAAAVAALPAAPPAGKTAGLDSGTATPEPEADNSLMIAALNNLPAPAAGTAPDRPSANTPSETPPESAAEREPGKPEITAAKPYNSAPAQPTPLAQLNAQDVPAKPLQAPDKVIKQTGKTGDWSINLASYSRQSTAEKMQSRFLDKGVTADQVVATVNGKTFYRLRVTGFENRQAALAQSTIIKERLGLKEAWITKE